jgi:tripartite-type tricarboxylate transporter receptor subunit TctC
MMLDCALGQQVLVDNRAGAGGTVGPELGVKAPADGYTLTLIAASYTVGPSMYKLTFDRMNDITPVIQLSQGPFLLAAPDIPTISESGLKGYEVILWHGLIAPKNLPQPVLSRLNSELNAALKSKDMEERLSGDGVAPAGGTPTSISRGDPERCRGLEGCSQEAGTESGLRVHSCERYGL